MAHMKLTAAMVLCALVGHADQESYKPGDIGEYYEYDNEGTPKERARRQHKQQLGRAIKKPFKGIYHGVKISKKSLGKTKNALENYLKGPLNEDEKIKLNRALTDWEIALGSGVFNQQAKNPQGLTYVPKEAWRLFKYSLYKLGFSLPRSLKSGAKNIVYNTCSGIIDEKDD